MGRKGRFPCRPSCCACAAVATKLALCSSKKDRRSEEAFEKGLRLIRDADDLIRRLPVELEIELGLGLTVVPVVEGLGIISPEWPLGECGALDCYAHAPRLSCNAAFLRDRLGGGDDATRDQALAAIGLA